MVIVGAVDQSDRAARVAKEAETLANEFGDEIHLIHAVKRSEFLDSGFAGARSEQQADISEVQETAADIAEEAGQNLDTQYESVGLVGKPADTVVKYADEQDARYIVVSPRKRSRTGKALFGSTAQSVLLNSTCPIVSTIQE